MRFSNVYGTNSVMMNSIHVALAAGSAGRGDINTGTDKVLTFQGAPSVNLSPGDAVFSDPVNFNLPCLTNLAISIYFGNVSATTITGHPGSRTTSFILPGNAITAASLPSANPTAHWYLITGVEVFTDISGNTVVTLGDSITDGRGSTANANNRWPDDLANRLLAYAPTSGVGVDNMGVGGNGIFGGLGVAAQKRFDRDILNQDGVRYFICFEGVNDIGNGTTAASLIPVYQQFASKAHARGLLAYGATITPFGGNSYYTVAHEAERQKVNAWFRTNSVFDGVIDFDAAVRDPVTRTNFQAVFYPGANASDWLHLNPLGYQTMANAIDLNLFTK